MNREERQRMVEAVRGRIVQAMEVSCYDHRPLLTEAVKAAFPHMLETNQLDYARFKLAVAKVLKPRTILEIGVGWGVSANAFLVGHPAAELHGIDNGEMGVEPGSVLVVAGATWTIADTAKLERFEHPSGQIDLIHIDGGHGRLHKADDMVKALQARPEWILVDDINDVMVAAGAFDGLYKAARNPLDATIFNDTHTGNLLIYVGRAEAENR
jgi:predicted O-methyltransferase YrrM